MILPALATMSTGSDKVSVGIYPRRLSRTATRTLSLQTIIRPITTLSASRRRLTRSVIELG